jgi:hypothetical protein
VLVEAYGRQHAGGRIDPPKAPTAGPQGAAPGAVADAGAGAGTGAGAGVPGALPASALRERTNSRTLERDRHQLGTWSVSVPRLSARRTEPALTARPRRGPWRCAETTARCSSPESLKVANPALRLRAGYWWLVVAAASAGGAVRHTSAAATARRPRATACMGALHPTPSQGSIRVWGCIGRAPGLRRCGHRGIDRGSSLDGNCTADRTNVLGCFEHLGIRRSDAWSQMTDQSCPERKEASGKRMLRLAGIS